jgi:hypothetical protein
MTREKTETSKPDISTTSVQDVFTEIVIDLKSNSIKSQLPPINTCRFNEACDCKFSKDSFVCNDSFEYGKQGSSLQITKFNHIDISRKSGLTSVSYLSTDLIILSPQYFTNTMEKGEGQLQCKPVSANKF